MQKQVVPTSGAVGALGITKDQSSQEMPSQADAADPDTSRPSQTADQTPPALFQLASGFFQGMRQADAGSTSASQDLDEDVACTSAGEGS
jgi:hypothetical protein